MSTRNLAVFAGVLAIGLIVFGVVMISTSDGSYTAKTPTPKASASTSASKGSDKLESTDIKVGDGAEAVAGKKVSVNYKGTLKDGTQFDSSYDRGEPFSFTLGSGSVIKGWDEGVVGMKVGGKRKLVIPPDMAYGSQAVGKIPANSTLTFEIELLGVE